MSPITVWTSFEDCPTLFIQSTQMVALGKCSKIHLASVDTGSKIKFFPKASLINDKWCWNFCEVHNYIHLWTPLIYWGKNSEETHKLPIVSFTIYAIKDGARWEVVVSEHTHWPLGGSCIIGFNNTHWPLGGPRIIWRVIMNTCAHVHLY